MKTQLLATISALAAMAQLPGQSVKAPAKPAQSNAALARTPDGHPDLEGVWTNATITRMERLPEFNGKLAVTDAEAAKYEAKDHDVRKNPVATD